MNMKRQENLPRRRDWAALRRFLGAVLMTWVVPACVDVHEPEAPDVVLSGDSSSANTLCRCDAEEMVGRTYRFTRWEFDEPSALAGTLNSVWATDIASQALNILFSVQSATAGGTTAFDPLVVTAGPGWRSPSLPYVMTTEDGVTAQDQVESYCLLPDMGQTIELAPYHGYQCQVKNAEAGTLFFHFGPKTNPLMCGPSLDPPNITPIRSLKIRFGFNEDCTAIDSGFLEGCITVEDASRLCMCMVTGTCEGLFDESASVDENDPYAYCENACGSSWISLGSIMNTFSVAPTCLTEDENPGYRIQAFFDAEEITDRFNAQSSDDCSQGSR